MNVIKRKNAFWITWESKPINYLVYKQIKKWVNNTTDYSALNERKLNSLSADIYEMNKRLHTSISMDQVISTRNALLKQKIIRNQRRMNKSIRFITREYNKKRSILFLSENYDFAPLSLLRGILLNKGYSSSELRNIFVHKKEPDTLKGWDLEQFIIAESNDAQSYFNQETIARVAKEKEDQFVKTLQAQNIQLKTEDDLAAEQITEHGQAKLTPDVLFIDEVYINNKRVYWIDYKNYIGSTTEFLYTSNKHQAEKYNKAFGSGAICYGYSFYDNVKIDNTITLDGKILQM